MAQLFLLLSLEASGESYLKMHLLGPEDGLAFCLKRVSKKGNSEKTKPDLFDTAEIELELSRQGTMRFIKDYHLLERRTEIGSSYRRLQRASQFCNLLITNGSYMPDVHALYYLASRSLDAFQERGTPDVVYLKSIFLLLKEEGFPVSESWWPSLCQEMRSIAKQFIERPCPETLSDEEEDACVHLIEHLENWIRRETELILSHRSN